MVDDEQLQRDKQAIIDVLTAPFRDGFDDVKIPKRTPEEWAETAAELKRLARALGVSEDHITLFGELEKCYNEHIAGISPFLKECADEATKLPEDQ